VDLRQAIREGRVGLSPVGVVGRGADGIPPYVVNIGEVEVEPISTYLSELVLSDTSPLTVKSYAYDLLRWWRLLALVEVAWDRAGRGEVELLVGWLRSAANPQRRRSSLSVPEPGSVNLKTGKQALGAGYAPSTINHQLTVLAGFYEFHMLFGRGPLVNPVPVAADRRRLLEHRSPLEPVRASELLEMIGKRVDWGRQRIWVVSKGSREVSMVPGSPEAFSYLARYFDAYGTPRPQERVWRTMRGARRPLTYWAMRRVMQRANDRLGTNWSLHDLRHTAATRMASDPELTLPEVQTIMRHRHLATTEAYLQPRIEELHDKLQEHFRRPRPEQTYPAGYRPEDVETVFGE